ncbi:MULTISPECIES: YchJ family protein [Microbacterium]|uniref:YchJ family metal-binding protein n=2 Tax=Actinomycetes TaxID=1760 RepID=A0ABV3LFI9_9MICO|nr:MULTISPECIES: YchJ family metal-binding protein [Microbacterium]MCE7480830.1 SEC-C domain-containing protein [Microbacterium profundi]
MRCPCLSGDTFETCCAPLLAAEATAPTAERLMRSRFTAFAVGDAPYLLRSWHPSTRPRDLELDTDIRWTRLDILETEAGGPFDTSGIVSFEAFYREGGVQASMKERSRFVREDRMWSYVDGAPVE